MLTISEYTGQLIGGPDDGNLVTSSVTKIPTLSTISLKLDGPDGDSDVIATEGVYVWQATSKTFLWRMIKSTVCKK